MQQQQQWLDIEPSPPTVLAPKVPWCSLHLPIPAKAAPPAKERYHQTGILGRTSVLQANALQNLSQLNGQRSSIDDVVTQRKLRGEQAAAENKKQLHAFVNSGSHRSLDPAGHGPGFVTLKQRYNALAAKAQQHGEILDSHRSHIDAKKELEKASAKGEKAEKKAGAAAATEVPVLDLQDPAVVRRQTLFGDGLPSSAREVARRRFKPQQQQRPSLSAADGADETLLPPSGKAGSRMSGGLRSKTPTSGGARSKTPLDSTRPDSAQAVLSALARPPSAPSVTTRCKEIEGKVLQNQAIVDDFRKNIDDVFKYRQGGPERLVADLEALRSYVQAALPPANATSEE
mmetsp:Transcript_65833/g.157324  ORF Transcript_65833/g.157324 Transcript_65833/m.157324 type:complete len:344 (-) Transcript_65833:54-1085(-)